MLRTTEPVIIISKREFEDLINLAVKKAVAEAMLAVGYRTTTHSNDQNIRQRPHVDGSILRIGQVQDLIGLSRASIYRLIKAGEFPAPIKLGKHASGWQDSIVRTWINERDQASPPTALASR